MIKELDSHIDRKTYKNIFFLGKKSYICEHCGKAFAQNSSMYIHKRGQHPEKFRKVGSVYSKSKEAELENDPDDPTAVDNIHTNNESNKNSNTENETNNSEKSSNRETADTINDQHQVFKSDTIIIVPKIKVESENNDEKDLFERKEEPEVGTDKSEHIDMSDYGFYIKEELLKSEAINDLDDLKSEIKIDLS